VCCISEVALATVPAAPAGLAPSVLMGLFDVITGRRKLAGPAPDKLFTISSANVTFEALDLGTSGAAAIVFQPLDTADFASIVKDMEEVVRATAKDSGTQVESSDDSYGYRWLILRGQDFDDLVVNINAVSSSLQDGGYGERVLCAVFAFRDAQSRRIYWIYNYKRGTYYPFVPAGGEQQRDNERELVLKAQVASDLPIEPELARWFPLWGIPI
jgi:hypothetical protein